MEINRRTSNKECLEAGRVKVLLDKSVSLTKSVPIWAEEVKFIAIIDREKELVMNFAREERQRESGKFQLKQWERGVGRKMMMTSPAHFRD